MTEDDLKSIEKALLHPPAEMPHALWSYCHNLIAEVRRLREIATEVVEAFRGKHSCCECLCDSYEAEIITKLRAALEGSPPKTAGDTR